jgi:iron complex transport system ATP-binding protein
MAEGIEARGLSVRRGAAAVLDRVDLVASPGALLAITGPNGAGKTTLLKALLGLVPASGEVRVEGAPLASLGAAERARRIGYVPQRSGLAAALAVEDVVAQARFARAEGAAARVEGALGRAGVAHLRARSFDTLSGGEQRSVLLARALASGARALLLDEPTAGLDVAQVLRFFALLGTLKREGYTLVCVLHDLVDVHRHAEHTLLLQRGRVLAAGLTGEVLTTTALRDVYGVHTHHGVALGFSLDGRYA